MPGLVFTPRYLKMKKPAQIRNYVKYIATRPNAESFVLDHPAEATEKQKEWIEKEIKMNPELKSTCCFEYEDYINNPTIENASELIRKISEESMETNAGVENYVGYLAKRPRAERMEQGHALWNGSDEFIDLNQAAKEAAAHKGNIWTFVVSLKREDAERLGFDNANAWRELARGKSVELANALGIPIKNFVWYGAFHNEGHHPHIHLMCYSKNPREGYLGKKNLMRLRSSFAAEIFKDDLYHIYEQKDEVRNSLKEYFDEELKKAAAMDYSENPEIEMLLWQLAGSLKGTKHKKVYGRLDKENRLLVDKIVKEISRDEKIDGLYQSWLGLKDDILSTYRNQRRARKSLADEPEFRNIKNLVLKYANSLNEENFDLPDGKITEEGEEERESSERSERRRNCCLRLLKHIGRMIEDDYSRKGQRAAAADKKLLSKILEKKEAMGQKL